MNEPIQDRRAHTRALVIAWQLVSERRRIVEALTPLISGTEDFLANMEVWKLIYSIVLPFCDDRVNFLYDDRQELIKKMEPHPLIPLVK